MNDKIRLDLIRARRQEKHLSQGEMAEALGLTGIDQYSRRESGEYNFKATELPTLSRMLNVPIEDFFASNVEKIAKGATV